MTISKYTQADIITAGIILCPQQELMGSARVPKVEDVTWGGWEASTERVEVCWKKKKLTNMAINISTGAGYYTWVHISP